jgi:hypothetical protein
MTTLFLLCAGIGSGALLLQTVLGLFGLDHGSDGGGGFHLGTSTLGEGLELLSVRAVSAGFAFFGFGGLLAGSLGYGTGVASAVGGLCGLAAMVATAWLSRQVKNLESDGSLNMDRAIGATATVYLTIPAGQGGPGKVHLALQGRTVELEAVTVDDRPIPRGASVVVVSVLGSDTVEVLPTSRIQEVLDGTV